MGRREEVSYRNAPRSYHLVNCFPFFSLLKAFPLFCPSSWIYYTIPTLTFNPFPLLSIGIPIKMIHGPNLHQPLFLQSPLLWNAPLNSHFFLSILRYFKYLWSEACDQIDLPKVPLPHYRPSRHTCSSIILHRHVFTVIVTVIVRRYITTIKLLYEKVVFRGC